MCAGYGAVKTRAKSIKTLGHLLIVMQNLCCKELGRSKLRLFDTMIPEADCFDNISTNSTYETMH